ncbi:MAG: T9SS type A sorting domain-containing protein [Flavobacteriales bacterium]|jgi:hypothetical protein
MKKILLSISFIALVSAAAAQCDPNSYDWAGAAFGVSPNPTLGETFEVGTVGQPYVDQIFVRTPATIADIEGAPDLAVAIDSLSLDNITFMLGDVEQDLSVLGLTVTCNNNGVSPNPCTFFANGNYCGDVTGTPTISGTFPVKIYATGYFNFFGPQEVENVFENYEIIIQGNDVNVRETSAPLEMSLGNPSPNPSNISATIPFDLTTNGTVQFTLYNMLGEMVERRTVSGKKGNNSLTVETQNLKSGVYLYSIQAGEKKFTKRLMVQH